MLAGILVFSMNPSPLYAEVLRSDYIMGQTMEARGLQASECPTIDAKYAIVINGDGEIYYERSANEPTYIASVTKIMTAVIALEYATADTQIKVSENADYTGESSAGLQAGDLLDLQNALIALMVPSGNDAAVAISENIGKMLLAEEAGTATDAQAMEAFISAMNSKATELGCKDTLFENPHGLDFDDYAGKLHSTAFDVSLIAKYAMQNSTFRSIVKMQSAEIHLTRNGVDIAIPVNSTDALIGNYEGACGIKTGNTELAGPCFAGACERNGKYLYAIVLDSSSEEQRFVDARILFNWVYDNQIEYKLANSNKYIEVKDNSGDWKEVPVVAYVSISSWLNKTVPATLSDPSKAVSVFRLEGNISQDFEFYDLNGSVRAGDVIGKVRFYQRNEQIADQDLIACEDIPAPTFFDTISIWFTRFSNLFTGGQDVAENVVINETPLILEKG